MSDLTSAFLYILIVLITTSIIVFWIVYYNCHKNPFFYPHETIRIDISGRRKPSYMNCIDEWFIENRYDVNELFDNNYKAWKKHCGSILKKTRLWKNYKKNIYQNMKKKVTSDDYAMFEFIFYRNQTRYIQKNYQKTSYTEENVENVIRLTLQDMKKIDNSLAEIDYETTREKYNAEEQRRLMTPALKKQIKERDNYTCQICGKYMGDEVGLHVDHKISIKNGGKSVPSNLWVLCDKCNLGKGRKNIDGTNTNYNTSIENTMPSSINKTKKLSKEINSDEFINEVIRATAPQIGSTVGRATPQTGRVIGQLAESIMRTLFKYLRKS